LGIAVLIRWENGFNKKREGKGTSKPEGEWERESGGGCGKYAPEMPEVNPVIRQKGRERTGMGEWVFPELVSYWWPGAWGSGEC
jgi:hypothetical protein